MEPESPEIPVPFPNILFLGSFRGGDLVLLAYDRGINRFALFQHFIVQGLREDANIIYAYYSTNLVAPFKKEIAERKVTLYELRNGVEGLISLISSMKHEAPGDTRRISVVLDFSRPEDLPAVIGILPFLKDRSGSGVLFSGVVALDLNILDDASFREMASVIPSVIFVSEKTNILAFPDVLRSPGVAGILPLDVVDSVVRHSLEQLILMRLGLPVSGFDILRDISDRFHVEIPLARVYSYLYTLETKGLVTTEIRGRAKLYVPTENGRIFIRRRLSDLQAAHEFILGYKR